MSKRVGTENSRSSGAAPLPEVPPALREILTYNSETAMAVVQHLRIVEANAAFADLLGAADAGDLRGRKLADFMSPGNLTKAAEVLEQWRGQRGESVVCEFTGCDGESVPAVLQCLRLPANPTLVLLLADDSVGRCLAVQGNNAEEDIVPGLVSSISHEVRNPLTAIMGYCKALLDEVVGPLNDSQKVTAQKIMDAAKAMLAVAEDMILSARANHVAFSIHPRLCKPWRVAKAVYEFSKAAADAKGVQTVFKARVEAIRGVYDREKLRTVLNNLLSNAINYTESGCVEMMVDSRPDGFEAVVTDTGIGIPDEKLAALFAGPDVPPNGGSTARRGSGLGLVMAARMIEAMGGTLAVSTEEGTGSAFTLYLPTLSQSVVRQ